MNNRTLLLLAALSLSTLVGTAAESQGPQRGEGGERMRPQRRQGTPWNNDLKLLRSKDGMEFTERTTFVERAGVPCLTQDKNGRLIAVFQWFPFERRDAFDKIAVKFSEDSGKTWSAPRAIELSTLPPGYDRAFDPTLVALADGGFRLYFTSKQEPGNTAIFSAVSKDAVHYTFEPGMRFGVDGENVVDCSVAKLGDTWHLYAPVPRENGRAYHAVSKDGLKFERKAEVSVSGRASWIGNVIAVDDGLRFFGSGVGWSARSKDGSTWQREEGSRANGGDPAAWHLQDRSYLMIVTGEPRDDAPRNPPWMGNVGAVEERGEGNRSPNERGNREESPNAGNGPFRELFSPGMPGVTMTVNADYLYVHRGGTIFMYNARTLEFVREARLPAAEPQRRGEGPSRPLREH
jgi:hypothetical protein